MFDTFNNFIFNDVFTALKSLHGLADLIFPLMALIAGSIFTFIGYKLKQNSKKFVGSTIIEGTIVDLRKSSDKNSRNAFPTIEYSWKNKTKIFDGSLALYEAKIGQLIDIEINSGGDTRIKSKDHLILENILLILGIITVLTGIGVALR